MKYLILISHVILLALLGSCRKEAAFDATGTFEADETIISAEVTGVIRAFDLEEGQFLTDSAIVGYIDTVQLALKKKQLEAQIKAILSKRPDISIQLAHLHEQLEIAIRERTRIQNLVQADAATPKQLDEVEDNIKLIRRQIDAQGATLVLSRNGLNQEALPMAVQAEQVADQIRRSVIQNPVSGTVLAKYAEANEMATTGKPLYKIADLRTLILRAYISGDQLPAIKLNQTVTVATDDGNGSMKQTKGTIIWVSDKAEFTPKTIQTKDERSNRVYAMKVKVANDGSYKIGMYGELKF